MAHRVVCIQFTPGSTRQWRLHGEVRREAAHLWCRMVNLHGRIRRTRWKWPSETKLRQWAKGKFPRLHSQSVQEIITEFLEAVHSTRQKRKLGDDTARYPWRHMRYRDVPYTQTAQPKDGVVQFACGRDEAGKRAYVTVRVPDNLVLPGRVIEGRLEFCKAVLVCEMPDAEPSETKASVIGVDLGVNTLIAATDGHRALLISGHEAKAIMQLRNKRLAEITALQAKRTKGSRRWKDLQRTKRQMLARCSRQLDDLVHKATRLVADQFPGAVAFVGKAFNAAAQKTRRQQSQLVSQAVNGKIIRQLQYKLTNATEIDEHFTSQTCPVCLERRKQTRFRRCVTCCYRVPRDVVGATNIRTKGLYGQIKPVLLPAIVMYRRPLLRLSQQGRARSSGGHPACGSTTLSLVA